ncbi:MAG: FkbM family methyltransferase [Nostoc sp. NMS7]|uniref:FkbM family methyltransferase n=1 Tax=Nostoc sp. NMS7 TaxID=2815391 RepID=UPI0025E955ED|nr:FkbM family methyltransferase [Nostoc sp. NMS7]MBN3946540.1 FkbM family methyltransferase [Nostoc sp. NMS7]
MNSLISSIIQSQYIINTRSFLRKNSGGRKFLSYISNKISKGYESNFQAELVRYIKVGDVVWDIGANVGYYTQQILNLVGNEGKVIAVEPSPLSAQACRKISNSGNLIVIESALSSKIGTTYFSINDDPTSPKNRLSDSGNISNTIEIAITTGDNLLQQSGYAPNVIKIDVEGAEIEVLRGMQQVLAYSDLRAIFIEVHSQILEQNGYYDAIKIITQILNNNGFNTNWTDFSHIEAIRK